MQSARMRQTTVRFGPDLSAALEAEAQRLGVSVAHYLGDAALARLVAVSRDGGAVTAPCDASGGRKVACLAERVTAQLGNAGAVRAQGRLARGGAQRRRVQADMLKLRVRAPISRPSFDDDVSRPRVRR